MTKAARAETAMGELPYLSAYSQSSKDNCRS